MYNTLLVQNMFKWSPILHGQSHLATSGGGNDEAVMLRQRILVQAVIKAGISCQFVDFENIFF